MFSPSRRDHNTMQCAHDTMRRAVSVDTHNAPPCLGCTPSIPCISSTFLNVCAPPDPARGSMLPYLYLRRSYQPLACPRHAMTPHTDQRQSQPDSQVAQAQQLNAESSVQTPHRNCAGLQNDPRNVGPVTCGVRRKVSCACGKHSTHSCA